MWCARGVLSLYHRTFFPLQIVLAIASVAADMAWLLLRGSGYPFSVSYETESGPSVSSQTVQALDKIQCAGQMRIAVLRRDAARLGFVVVVSLLAILVSEEALLACLLDRQIKGAREIRYTNRKYKDHFMTIAKNFRFDEVLDLTLHAGEGVVRAHYDQLNNGIQQG